MSDKHDKYEVRNTTYRFRTTSHVPAPHYLYLRLDSYERGRLTDMGV